MAGNQHGKTRDRRSTEEGIVHAVGALIAREGFGKVGVNAIAREAGVDKVLIYRYFGGLDGLIAEYARSRDFWPTIDELTGGDPEAFRRIPIVERAVLFFRNYLRAIRSRPLTQEILAWETIKRNEIMDQLETARLELARQSWALFGGMESNPVPPALPAMLIAGVQYLTIRARVSRWFAGLDIQSEAGWREVERAQELIIRGALESLGLRDE